MKLPLAITVQANDDEIVEWSKTNEALLHKAGVTGAIQLITFPELEEVILIDFYEHNSGSLPFADIAILREDIEVTMSSALNYYVENEMFEEAAWVKNSRQS